MPEDSASVESIGIPKQFAGEEKIPLAQLDLGGEGWVVFLLNLFFLINVVLSFLYLIWGGFTLITAGGDTGRTKQGKDGLMFAVLGLFISILALIGIRVFSEAFQLGIPLPTL